MREKDRHNFGVMEIRCLMRFRRMTGMVREKIQEVKYTAFVREETTGGVD